MKSQGLGDIGERMVEVPLEPPKRRFRRKLPPVRTAPEKCEACSKRYDRHGPVRFKGKWICSRCLLEPLELVIS